MITNHLSKPKTDLVPSPDVRLCYYCSRDVTFNTVYIIKQRVKPKGHRNCHKTVGYCCELCYDSGCDIHIGV